MIDTFLEFLSEAPRIRIVPIRIRTINGRPQIQRRKKVSNVKGFTIRGGKMVRMTPQERMHRKMGARKGKIKRRAKARLIARKRQRTMMRRHSMGL